MSDDPTYDGLCGIPYRYPLMDGRFLRCRFELGHGGDHSWEPHKRHAVSWLGGVLTVDDVVRMLRPVPENCRCTPIRSNTGEIVDYVFAPDCAVHAK